MKKTICLSVLLAGLSLAIAPFASAKQHAFIWDSVHGMKDLGTLGGKNSYATGINDLGEVVGYSDFGNGTHAFTWTRAGGMVDIGIFFTGQASNQAASINEQGAIAGTGTRIVTGNDVPAFFQPPNTWTPLPNSPGYYLNFSFGINNSNQLTGQFYTDPVNAFFWDPANSIFFFLPTLPGGFHTVGNSINDFGHITGTGSTPSGSFDALLWTAGGGSQDIGSLNGSGYTAGGAVNNNDEVVGYNSPELAGFYWSQSTGLLPLQSLGGTMSAAFAINRHGQIAGFSSTADGTIHATLWSGHATAPQDLGTLGGTNSYARGVNNRGQVVGYSDKN